MRRRGSWQKAVSPTEVATFIHRFRSAEIATRGAGRGTFFTCAVAVGKRNVAIGRSHRQPWVTPRILLAGQQPPSLWGVRAV